MSQQTGNFMGGAQTAAPSQQQQQVQPQQTNGSSAIVPDPASTNTTTLDSDKNRVEDILKSDVGVNALLMKLRQSIVSCRDFAGFLKKRAAIEEEHANALKKLCKVTFESIHRPEGRQGTYLTSFENATRIHDRLAENGTTFANALYQMQDDLFELVNNMERGRKEWKQNIQALEKRIPDAVQHLHKIKSKYDSAADEYERVRGGGGKSALPFGLGGPRNSAHHEEDLRRKLDAADTEFSRMVITTNNVQTEVFNSQRPQAVAALKALIQESDAGLTLQLQKFASLNEKLVLNDGLCISPIKTAQATETDAPGLTDVIQKVDNEADLRSFLLEFSSKVPQGVVPIEHKYEKHAALAQPPGQNQQNAPQQQQQQFAQGGGAFQPSSPNQQNNSQQQLAGYQQTGQQQQQAQQSQADFGSQGQQYQQQQTQQNRPPPQQQLQQQQQQPQQYRSPLQSQQQQQQQQQQQVPPQVQQSVSNNQQTAQSPIQPNQQASRPLFGVPLEALLVRDGNAVPAVVMQCMQAVDLFGLNCEGIYRHPGANTHVQKIKQTFDNDPSRVDFRNPEDFFHDVNSVASALKQFFRELPDPLFTNELYDEFIKSAQSQDKELRRDTLHELVNRLPDANYATIRGLILHLNRVMQHSDVNKMTAQNLAICFGPTLFGSGSPQHMANMHWHNMIIETVLMNTFEIFEDD